MDIGKCNYGDEQRLVDEGFLKSTRELYLLGSGRVEEIPTSTTNAAKSIIALAHLIIYMERVRGNIFVIADARHYPTEPEIHGRIVCRDNRYLAQFKELIEHLGKTCEYIEFELPMHQKNPRFEFFYAEVRRLNLYLPQLEFEQIFFGEGDATRKMCDSLNALVDSMRKIGSNKVVNKAMKRFRRAALSNYRNATSYIDKMFAVYSRMCILRVDLGYEKRHVGNISEEAFLRHRKKLLVYLQRHTDFERMIGYVIKTEHGRAKGFHIHALILFDGRFVRQGISRATMIGNLWATTITGGIGTHFNCHIKNNYYYSGIDMLRHDDASKRKGLDIAIKYMTKSDEIARIRLGNSRIFMKGIAPKLGGVKLGRPRAFKLHTDTQQAKIVNHFRTR